MKNRYPLDQLYLIIGMGIAILVGGLAPQQATAMTDQEKYDLVRTTGLPDYNGSPNWAYSPPMQKFVDTLPNLCGPADAGKNNLGQCLPVAVPDTTTYPGSDYYELEIVQFREQMHSNLPPLVGGDAMTATSGGTLLRGYRQVNTSDPDALTPHNLGPVIIATRDRPVRLKFTNSLPTGLGGDLFIPTDTTVMGSGPGPLHDRAGDPRSEDEVCQQEPTKCFSQNRAVLHLHGGRTPWISDGTAHQWITPATEIESPDPRDPYYSKGVSVAYVPDMWYDSTTGSHITSCAGKTVCTVANATNNPGKGSQTYYWTNAQSARLMFYHEHSWGITRLGVYAGGVAGYLITDDTETELVGSGLIPDAAHTMPLIIQDKTFVDATTIIDNPDTPGIANDGTDPTWIWGSKPGDLRPWYHIYDGDVTTDPGFGADPDVHPVTGDITEPVTGDLWWPHVYVPAQNPYNPDGSGVDPYGRWHFGPWFWPPTDVPWGPTVNPYYDGPDGEQANRIPDPQPPEIPGTPNPSWGAEAFLDTPVVNGTAYPRLEVEAAAYRFKILNGAHDRFWNLQLYVADATLPTEVAMVPAQVTPGFPGDGDGDFPWPADGRDGGVPNPARRGPAMVQIGTDGGFLPAPVVLPNRPVQWNVDVTTFTAGLVLQQNQGGGTLMLGPAERADVIIDFSQFAGKTLILYNDAPAPWPALDPHYDYYTGNPDYREIGGAKSTLPGMGPNTRTIMQIVVAGTPNTTPGPVNAVPANLAALETAFLPRSSGGLGIFDEGQEPIIVGQAAYNSNYNVTFPSTWPNWGLSRITDTAISFKTPSGATVTAYPMEPKAIQDEMGEVFDEFGRMSAKLGLELAKTTAGIQTFILQNFVDPPTEIVAKDQIQIWKITHNGVDTHPVHFHLFEVQLLNRVGWDGFMYFPDENELGWKDTIRISPLQDTIVALRPAKVPVPFTVPNSLRPLNPAYPLGSTGGFTNLDPVTGQPATPTVINEVFNFGHEYLWHCHILSHEEQDMMRVIVLNANSLLYTLNTDGFWEWDRGEWNQIFTGIPENYVAWGTSAYADLGLDGLWQWNGYDWRQIEAKDPIEMVASESGLFVTFSDGLYQWNKNTWKRINTRIPDTGSMIVADSGLYLSYTGYGLYKFDGAWTRINTRLPDPGSVVAAGMDVYMSFTGFGFYRYNGSWTLINSRVPDNGNVIASQSDLYLSYTGYGLYKYNGGWTLINSRIPDAGSMVASGTNLYASYTGYGLYNYKGIWQRIDPTIPVDMAISGSVLFANFGGFVSKWESYGNEGEGFGRWSPLSNSSLVDSMIAGF